MPAAVRAYHMRVVRQTFGEKAPNVTITAELWFAGAGRRRSTEQERDAAGAVVSSQDVLFDGPETWIANRDPRQRFVVHTTGTTWTQPVQDANRSASLADALARYSSATTRSGRAGGRAVAATAPWPWPATSSCATPTGGCPGRLSTRAPPTGP